MSHYVYILRSEASGRYYCGQTQDLAHRLDEHNDPECMGTMTTKRCTGPWRLVWHRELGTRSEAIRIERKIKARGIGRFLEDIEVRER